MPICTLYNIRARRAEIAGSLLATGDWRHDLTIHLATTGRAVSDAIRSILSGNHHQEPRGPVDDALSLACAFPSQLIAAAFSRNAAHAR